LKFAFLNDVDFSQSGLKRDKS